MQYTVENFKSIPDEQRNALYMQRDVLTESRTTLEDTLNRLLKSKSFLEQISKKVIFAAERVRAWEASIWHGCGGGLMRLIRVTRDRFHSHFMLRRQQEWILVGWK